MIDIQSKRRKNCDNCGAPLPPGYGQVTCPYCGTTYIADSMGQIVVVEKRSGVIPLGIRQSVRWEDIEYLGKDRIMDMVRKEMANRLAAEVMKHMRFEMEDDLFDRNQVYRGSIRILNDDFEFER